MSRLQVQIEGNHLTDAETLATYSRDASIFKITPSEVIEPKNAHDVALVVQAVTDARTHGDSDISITARAAGTDMSGGPLTKSVVLSFTKYLNAIHEIGTDYAVVEPGCYYRDLEKETLKKGLIFASYPASRELCAMGGILNNNSAGEKSLRYGKTLQYVREVTMVCADGNEYTFKPLQGSALDDVLQNDHTFFGDVHRAIYALVTTNTDVIASARPTVSKNSSGYYLWEVYKKETHTLDLTKLICGAQGTLGMVTSMKLGLIPVTPFSKMMVIMVKNVADIPAVTEAVLPHKPESFELFDDHTFKIAMKFFPDIVKRIGGNIFSLALQFLPEFFMIMTGGVPKVILLAEFTGTSNDEVEKHVAAAYTSVLALREVRSGISVRRVASEQEAKKYWTFRRESFNLLRSKLKGLRTAPFIEDVVIHAKDFPTFMPQFEQLLDSYKLVYTIAGHVGDGNLHVIPLMKLADDASIHTIEDLSKKVYALIRTFNGSISGEHNDGLIRTPFLHMMFSEKMLQLFGEVKRTFDPLGIFNPGKKVGGTWEESLAVVDRTI